MHWVVQNNLFNEAGHHDLVSALERGRIRHDIVKVIPFGGGIEPDLTLEGPVMIMGSQSLVNHARKRGWTPGAFLNDNFTYSAYADGFGRENMLNLDAIYGEFGTIKVPNVFFIRPADDGKSFAGTIMDREEFEEWRRKVLALETHYTTIDAKTEVMICTPKKIQREYRLFVVDEQIVTGSLYRIGTRVIVKAEEDPEVWRFGRKMIQRWQPDRAFVLDLSVIQEGYRVVEVNCLNSSGYYAADVSKLVQALDAMVF